MIAWTIEAALESGIFDRLLVSTDDDEIAQVSRAYGAEVPFQRPAEISDDHSGLTAVIRHAIDWSRNQGDIPETVACMYATAPFLRANDLAVSVSQLQNNLTTDYILAVTSFPSPVERALVSDKKGYLEFLWPEFATTRSQDLRDAYHDAGHFLMGRADALKQHSTSLSGNTLPYPIPRMLCQDIDTPEDWLHAEELFAYIHSKDSARGR